MTTIKTVTVTRYMQPLREGGSLPALAEADDGGKYDLDATVNQLFSQLVA